MISSLEIGDEAVTAGGILIGDENNEQYIELNISENTKIKIQKSSISAVLPKTLKSI